MADENFNVRVEERIKIRIGECNNLLFDRVNVVVVEMYLYTLFICLL